MWSGIVILNCLMISPPLNASSRASEGITSVSKTVMMMMTINEMSELINE